MDDKCIKDTVKDILPSKSNFRVELVKKSQERFKFLENPE